MSTPEYLRKNHEANMNDEFANIQVKPIWNYEYSQYFKEVPYNGKTLSDTERKEMVAYLDQMVEHYSEGIPLMREIIEKANDLHDEYYELERSVVSIMFFVLITMIDNLVASKYFLLADKDYDRRFMRGKLMVIYNEGFKRLYGFVTKKKGKNDSPEWKKLQPLMKHFPITVQNQYRELSSLLDINAKYSWWKDERNYEVHLEVENLYQSRQEEIIESKVMMDSMKLFNTLLAVNNFLGNMHTCLYNALVEKYRNGELKDD